MLAMKKILVSIDFSDASDKVINKVAELANTPEHEIYLLHVVEPSISYELTGVLPNEVPFPMLNNEERNSVKGMAMETLEEYADKLKKMTPATVKSVVSDEFEISDAIMEWAQENGMHLIVLGKHGRGFLANVLIGSVAISTVKHSKIPVLIVPVVDEEE